MHGIFFSVIFLDPARFTESVFEADLLWPCPVQLLPTEQSRGLRLQLLWRQEGNGDQGSVFINMV